MTIPFVHVDAFASQQFAGNAAVVCLLQRPADDQWMQSLAAEMNLSETAFVRKLDDGYELRWFTPVTEVDLCGHATLASAHALWREWDDTDDVVRFHTRSGVLTASKSASTITLDLPATPAVPQQPPNGLFEALGVTAPEFVGATKWDQLVVVGTATEVRSLSPNFPLLGKVKTRGVMVTAGGDDGRYDFISRYFAPRCGINEDPVTGSAHCGLGPYWSRRLNKASLLAYQASTRGGVVHVEVDGDRVRLGGEAITVLRGEVVEH